MCMMKYQISDYLKSENNKVYYTLKIMCIHYITPRHLLFFQYFPIRGMCLI